jgi:hypothetical protein
LRLGFPFVYVVSRNSRFDRDEIIQTETDVDVGASRTADAVRLLRDSLCRA